MEIFNINTVEGPINLKQEKARAHLKMFAREKLKMLEENACRKILPKEWEKFKNLLLFIAYNEPMPRFKNIFSRYNKISKKITAYFPDFHEEMMAVKKAFSKNKQNKKA